MKRIIPVNVHGVGLDPSTKDFVVILKDDQSNRWLPIYIGPFEAQAISLELENINPPRPLTHDLMRNILQTLGIGVTRVIITEIHDNTFFAKVGLKGNNIRMDIDSRPSDAIALALRMKAPIFVTEQVMKMAGVDEKAKPEAAEKDQIQELQERLQKAVEAEEFEEAARLRDQIRHLKEKEDKGD